MACNLIPPTVWCDILAQNVVGRTSSPPLILLGFFALAWREVKSFMAIITQRVQCRYVARSLVVCSHSFVTFIFTVFRFSDLMRKKRQFVEEIRTRDSEIMSFKLLSSASLCHPTCWHCTFSPNGITGLHYYCVCVRPFCSPLSSSVLLFTVWNKTSFAFSLSHFGISVRIVCECEHNVWLLCNEFPGVVSFRVISIMTYLVAIF